MVSMSSIPVVVAKIRFSHVHMNLQLIDCRCDLHEPGNVDEPVRHKVADTDSTDFSSLIRKYLK